MGTPEDTKEDLNKLRNAIDAVDAEVVELLSRRAELAIEVGEVKAKSGAKVEFYSPERERQVLERIASLNKGPIADKALCRIFREVMSVSLALEKPLRVAFLGPQATFTHQAAIDHFGLAVEYAPKADIAEVFDDVERGRVDFGVVPVENSAEGAVTHTLDKFLDSDLNIC
ncbi:MAG: chorismate mutase, partial [Deltaproteobacteria bacterium]|nr:chorismate mutase [Deltaproteobacteria bacterium]